MLTSTLPVNFLFLRLALSWMLLRFQAFEQLQCTRFFRFWRMPLGREAFFHFSDAFPPKYSIFLTNFTSSVFIHWFYQYAFRTMQYPIPNMWFFHRIAPFANQAFLSTLSPTHPLFPKPLPILFFRFTIFILNLYTFLLVQGWCFRDGNDRHFRKRQFFPPNQQWCHLFRRLQR